jgi:hypothetical protein
VAIVIPEIGFDVEPTSPTMREETVTKKKAKRTMRAAPNRLTGTPGQSHIPIAATIEPPITHLKGMSRSVRGTSPRATPLFICATPTRIDSQIVGRLLISVTIPPNPTAPAPM